MRPHLPKDPVLLAALGRVSVRHSFLDFVLRRTIKTIEERDLKEADKALEFDGSRTLRKKIRKAAAKRFGEASPTSLAIEDLLTECERLTEQRNRLVHDVWAIETDGDEPLLFRPDSETPIPPSADIDQLAEDIFRLATKINDERLTGFILQEMLKGKVPAVPKQ